MTEKEIRNENQKAYNEQNQLIKKAAVLSAPEILKFLHTTHSGLSEDTVILNRTRYGSNSITK